MFFFAIVKMKTVYIVPLGVKFIGILAKNGFYNIS